MKKFDFKTMRLINPTFVYAVTLECSSCGNIIMVFTVTAKSPTKAIEKVEAKLSEIGIIIGDTMSLTVEQI